MKSSYIMYFYLILINMTWKFFCSKCLLQYFQVNDIDAIPNDFHFAKREYYICSDNHTYHFVYLSRKTEGPRVYSPYIGRSARAK